MSIVRLVDGASWVGVEPMDLKIGDLVRKDDGELVFEVTKFGDGSNSPCLDFLVCGIIGPDGKIQKNGG